MKEKIIDLDKLNKQIKESIEEPSEVVEEYSGEENIEEKIIEDNSEDIPRLEDGSIDIESIAIVKDEKGRYIVSDDLFDKYYKEFPEGTGNESKTYKAYNKGKIKCLTSEDAYIQRMGAIASNAKQRQRRTFADAIEHLLTKKANKRIIEELELSQDADNMDMITAAALYQAAKGNVKAMEFLRDTVGEKPSEKIDASVTALTDEDKQMLENIQSRLQGKNR